MKVDAQKLLELFLQLIRIDSVSLHEQAMVDFLTQKFNGWQIEVSEDEAATRIGGNAGNLMVRLQGNSANSAPLVLLAHTDTVHSTAKVKPIIDNGIIHSDGTTILGADNRWMGIR